LHGTAVLTGPQVHNFKEAYAALLKADACIEIGSAQELAAKARKLLKNKKERKKLVTRARAAVAGMRGALDATVEALSAYLPAKKEQRRAS
jgi:3-deoxy-D-manno-octulosonic-acid transferase